MPQFSSLKPGSPSPEPSPGRKISSPGILPAGQWSPEQTKEAMDLIADIKNASTTQDKLNLLQRFEQLADRIQAEKQEALAQAAQIIQGQTPEGIEVNLDLTEQISYWNDFYQKYDIKDTNGNICTLPDTLRLTPDQLEQAKQDIERFGFDTLLIIPPHIKNSDLLNNDPLLTYPENEDKSTEDKRYLDSNIPADLLKHTTTATQIILLKNTPHVYQDNDWDSNKQTCDQVLAKEKELNINGLDLPAFLFFHRHHYDLTDTHAHNWRDKNATWLTRTADDTHAARAHWNPDDSQSDFDWASRDDCNGSLGAVFSRRFVSVDS